MKKILAICFLSVFLFNCVIEDKKENQTQKTTNNFAIVIHGGAGTILKKNMTDEKENAYKQKLKEAITIGHTVLKNGGTSQEACGKNHSGNGRISTI